MHTHTPTEHLQSFPVKSVIQKCKPSISLLSSRLVFSYAWVLLENGDGLWKHIVVPVEQKLRNPRSRLAQCWQVLQILYMYNKVFSNLLPFEDTEVNQMYTYRFYWLFTDIHRFPGVLGMVHAQAVTPGHLSPPTQPGNEANQTAL